MTWAGCRSDRLSSLELLMLALRMRREMQEMRLALAAATDFINAKGQRAEYVLWRLQNGR